MARAPIANAPIAIAPAANAPAASAALDSNFLIAGVIPIFAFSAPLGVATPRIDRGKADSLSKTVVPSALAAARHAPLKGRLLHHQPTGALDTKDVALVARLPESEHCAGRILND